MSLALPDNQAPEPILTFVECADDISIDLELIGRPTLFGYPIAGFPVEIDARAVKFQGSYPVLCRRSDFYQAVPAFAWSIVSQPGESTASLEGTATLRPRILLDEPGSFVVRLTVCPGPTGCLVERPSGGPPIPVESQTLEVSIEALMSAPLGPETMPELPPSAFVQRPRHDPMQNNCSFEAGVASAQWYAVEQIDGPDDYWALEGRVTRSRVSRKDSPFNHFSQDAIFDVLPDLPYLDLLFRGGGNDIEVEWERNRFPERYRPTAGDRASVFGHWIYDCAHSNKPEIHSPVGVVSQRPRPISVPSVPFAEFGGQAVGTNVWVPGIISDIYFHENGGRLLDCDVDTGLKNAELLSPPALPETCIPDPSLERIFEFNIYLPRNPQVTMAEAGLGVPPLPLYVADESPGALGPAPLIQVVTEENTSYLHVTLDLRGFAGAYERRIVAGWVLPDANNWGLERWKLRLNRLDVSDDGDGVGRGSGDWRLWVNTNNATNGGFARQEWTQIIGHDVTGVEDFGGRPWETGAASADRSLGPDLLRYPPPEVLAVPGPRDHRILFHSTGFEADTLTDDDAGTVAAWVPNREQVYRLPNQCSSQSDAWGLIYSGCVRYTANFEVLRGPGLPPVDLSEGASALAALYELVGCTQLDDDVEQPPGVCDRVPRSPIGPAIVHPADVILEVGSGPVLATELQPFRPGSREDALTDISIDEFYAVVAELRHSDPARLVRLLENLRSLFDERFADLDLAEEAALDIGIVKASLPKDLWEAYFSDIQLPASNPGLPKEKITGAGTILLSGGTRLKRLTLRCAAQRLPNSLTVQRGTDRFELDLALEAVCSDDPSVPNASKVGFDTQRGRGIGRFNGVPGAQIDWTLVDAGEPASGDSAVVTIRTGREGTIVLDIAGAVVRGDLQASGQ